MKQGQAAPQGDDVQYARVLALRNQLPVLATWRWRVLHSPADAPSFMITDRGWPGRRRGRPQAPRPGRHGDLDDYFAFHLEQEKRRNHDSRYRQAGPQAA